MPHARFVMLGLLLAAMLAAGGCGGDWSTNSLDALRWRDVRLPDGQTVHAELAVQPEELMRGLKYRESLAADHGMLFLHNQEGLYPYWMFECKMALDMIWMDRAHRIVEIAANVPPCAGPAESCPSYGGHEPAMYVLELAPGQAARHGLQKGQTIVF
jgi:uncharacterized membrane protein (UPF0127 family)